MNFKRSKTDDGLLQFLAGIGLVNCSGVLRWSEAINMFECPPDAEYKTFWETRFDPVFGRVASWNMFSTGAEFLLKGLFLSYDLLNRRTKGVRNYPTLTQPSAVKIWAENYKANSHDTFEVPQYGTLAQLIPDKGAQLFKILDLKRPAGQKPEFKAECDIVFAAYDLLRDTIRNRDAHAYVPNVRSAHQPLRQAVLLPALNAIAKWMPQDRTFISECYANRQALVDGASGSALAVGAPYPN